MTKFRALLVALAVGAGMLAVGSASAEAATPTVTNAYPSVVVVATEADAVKMRALEPASTQVLVKSGLTATGVNDCFSSKACFWVSINAGGALYMYEQGTPGSCQNTPTMDNTISSTKNRESRSYVIYVTPGCPSGDRRWTVGAGAYFSDLRAEGINDANSAIHWN
jgi:hypothetical protein